MNIQDRIAKLETQICQNIDELTKLKEEMSKENKIWIPRVGEIVEMSDDRESWYVQKFVDIEEGEETIYRFNGDYESFTFCRPLTDPMVIQLIPHVPGDPKPYGDANNVIVVFKSGEYDAANPRDFNWDDDNYEDNIVGWFDIT